ncbi:DegV family protein [Paenibacillus gansuensis]|uniref:DegV family protein n=1 Tax=Paenibacillus gansuensis TaxID=306542 RepID=A0ABW5PAK4_9BACL
MAILLISDGSADLPKEVLEESGVTIIPLSVHFEHEQFSSSELTSGQFYSKMKSETLLPKTSSPSPHDFMEIYKQAEGKDVLVLALSSALSSTYNHAKLAAEMMQEENYKGNIEVIDSRSASNGLGLMIYRAAQSIKEGFGFKEVVDRAKQEVADSRTLIFLETLENVVKGGRLDRVKGALASFLNIKLLMHRTDEGAIEVLEKVRGSQNAVKRLIDKIGEVREECGKKDVLAIAHSNCEEKAKAIRDMVMQRYTFREVHISEMGPVIGTYAGEGGIVVSL